MKTKIDRSNLMNVLWEVQCKKRHINHDDISKIAQEFDISRMELEGVITFYHFYHRTDCGKYTIYLDNSIVAKHAGMEKVKKAFEEALNIKVGNTTEDKMFGLFETACIGLSDMAPACLINFKPFVNLTPKKVKDIIRKLKSGSKPKDIYNIPKSKINYTPSLDKTVFFKEHDAFSSLNKLEKLSPKEVIEVVKKSKLAGRGGAFFPTGFKWELCSNNKADQKYVICNADEGEPGTFKDRVLMQEHPELMIEGMIFAAYAVGASKGAIYLRAEYRYLRKDLEKLLQKYRDHGFLGENIKAKQPFSFDIYIHLGAGAYVCGEETALIHSMEGKRGEPGNKVVFPVEKGFNQKPTLVNNVETLSAVPSILQMGVENWLKLGTEETRGTKIISVSGDCKNPGIYEIEWGMKVKDFLTLIEAENPHLILFNGYSGECLSPHDFDREISGENLLSGDVHFDADNPIDYKYKMAAVGVKSGGSFMVFNKDRDILEIIKNVSDFFVAESCGICVPCRTGNFLLSKKINKIISGLGEKKDMHDIKEWSKIIATTSRCGLGQMSSNLLTDAMKKFNIVFENKLTENTKFNNSFNLDKAVSEYDQIINEITTNYE